MVGIAHRPKFVLSLFALKIEPPNGGGEYQYQGKWNASLKPKTTHEKYTV